MFGFKKKTNLIQLFNETYTSIERLTNKELEKNLFGCKQENGLVYREIAPLVFSSAYLASKIYKKDQNLVGQRFEEWYKETSEGMFVPIYTEAFEERVAFFGRIANGEIPLLGSTLPTGMADTIKGLPVLMWMVVAYCDCLYDESNVFEYEERANERVKNSREQMKNLLFGLDEDEESKNLKVNKKDDGAYEEFFNRFTYPLYQICGKLVEHIGKDKLL